MFSKSLTDVLSDLSINLIAALIGVVVGLLWQKINAQRKLTKAKRFWRDMFGGAKIILGRMYQEKASKQGGHVTVGDANASSELLNFFRLIGLDQIEVTYSDWIRGDELKTNLVLIGGPAVNELTKPFLSQITTKYTYQEEEGESHKKYKMFDQEKGIIIHRTEGDIPVDRCLIIKAPNPFSQKHSVILIAGVGGLGTWAGARFATSKKFTEDSLARESAGVEFLIETDILYGMPQEIRIVDKHSFK